MSSVNFDASINSALAIKEAASQQKIAVALAQKAQQSVVESGAAVLSLLGQAVEVAQTLQSETQVNVVA